MARKRPCGGGGGAQGRLCGVFYRRPSRWRWERGRRAGRDSTAGRRWRCVGVVDGRTARWCPGASGDRAQAVLCRSRRRCAHGLTRLRVALARLGSGGRAWVCAGRGVRGRSGRGAVACAWRGRAHGLSRRRTAERGRAHEGKRGRAGRDARCGGRGRGRAWARGREEDRASQARCVARAACPGEGAAG